MSDRQIAKIGSSWYNPFFIAEIGSNWFDGNHNNDIQNIFDCVDYAIEVNATAVKFQIFTADTLYSKKRMPDVHKKVKDLEFPIDIIADLKQYCKENDIQLWASVFDVELLKRVAEHLDGIKIASGDITNYHLIDVACDYVNANRPIAFSTGASTRNEFIDAYELIRRKTIADNVVPFYCKSVYPLSSSDVFLFGVRVIKDFLTARLGGVHDIGFSDHTMFSDIAELATAMGVKYFEKHYNPIPEKNEKISPDASVSLSSDNYRAYVKSVTRAFKLTYSELDDFVILDEEFLERKNARRGSDGLRPDDR